jgi:hypothetical protein
MAKQLRRSCEQRLRSLRLPPDAADMRTVVAHLAATRDRPIHLRGVEMPPAGPSGAWLPTGDADYVFYESGTTPRHQTQIVAHELAHLVSGHTAAAHGRLVLLPLLAERAADIMLTREAYSSDEEREAEQLADLLVAHIERAANRPPEPDAFSAALRRSGSR